MKHNFKKFTILFTLVLLALAIFAAAGGPASAATCTITLAAGDNIQMAIDAASAGDVICLDPGTYTPVAKIVINKSITLQGPQAGVDPRPVASSSRIVGDSATEAVINGQPNNLSGIIVVRADNVILDGLDVTGSTGDMIESLTSPATTGTIVRYNIIHVSGDEGLQLRACTNCVIEYNYVPNIDQDGINLCCGSTGGTIQFNEVADNSSENAAIYIYEATATTIKCNDVHDVYENDGIKFGSKNGNDASNAGGSILYNTIHDTAQDGISVYMSGTTVEGNDVSNSSSENGAIYVAQAVSGVGIVYNNVHDNTLNAFKWGNPGAVTIGTAPDASTIHVNNNNITGNSVNGVTNKAVALLDAENNWWGAADGPGAVGPGTGDTVSLNVDFDPWLGQAVTIPDVCNPAPVDPQTIDDCKNGGWEAFGFKNQGQCIRFVNTGKDSR